MRRLFQSLRRNAGLIKLLAEISTILGFCFQYVFPLLIGLVAMLLVYFTAILLPHPGPGPNPPDPGTGTTASDPVGPGPERRGEIRETASDTAIPVVPPNHCEEWPDPRQRAICELHVPEKLLANDCQKWTDIKQRATCELHVSRVKRS
jgi:hypothetical protein